MNAKRLMSALQALLSPKSATDKQPLEDAETWQARYLSTLPTCAEHLVVASPRFGNHGYRGEVIASAALLQPWAERHCSQVFICAPAGQGANLALPVWLRTTNNQPLLDLPRPFIDVTLAYIEDLITERIARVTCPDCGDVADDLVMQESERESLGNGAKWVDEWRCQHGHILYYREQEVRWSRKRNH